jgi:hypothetical protein
LASCRFRRDGGGGNSAGFGLAEARPTTARASLGGRRLRCDAGGKPQKLRAPLPFYGRLLLPPTTVSHVLQILISFLFYFLNEDCYVLVLRINHQPHSLILRRGHQGFELNHSSNMGRELWYVTLIPKYNGAPLLKPSPKKSYFYVSRKYEKDQEHKFG